MNKYYKVNKKTWVTVDGMFIFVPRCKMMKVKKSKVKIKGKCHKIIYTLNT